MSIPLIFRPFIFLGFKYYSALVSFILYRNVLSSFGVSSELALKLSSDLFGNALSFSSLGVGCLMAYVSTNL